MTHATSSELDRVFDVAVRADIRGRLRDELAQQMDALYGEPLLRTHDWRNHLPKSIVELWDTLPLEARLVAFIIASVQAKSERWN